MIGADVRPDGTERPRPESLTGAVAIHWPGTGLGRVLSREPGEQLRHVPRFAEGFFGTFWGKRVPSQTHKGNRHERRPPSRSVSGLFDAFWRDMLSVSEWREA
jgi:hypothetical protein